MTCPNYLPEASRRPAPALGVGQGFGRSVHAQAVAVGGGRSAKR